MGTTPERVAAVVALVAAIWLIGGAARLSLARRRGRVLAEARHSPLAAEPVAGMAGGETGEGRDGAGGVHILAFSSDDCAQCHRLQAPALARVRALRPGIVRVTEVDAPTAPELTARFRVLTLPSTVVLDAAGVARAVNYGFAPSDRLLEQVDAALGVSATSGA